jgi:hypothetical protein
MDQLHQALSKRSPLYTWWHNEPHYKLIHWVVFILVGVLLTLALVLSIYHHSPYQTSSKADLLGVTKTISLQQGQVSNIDGFSLHLLSISSCGESDNDNIHKIVICPIQSNTASLEVDLPSGEQKIFDPLRAGDHIQADTLVIEVVQVRYPTSAMLRVTNNAGPDPVSGTLSIQGPASVSGQVGQALTPVTFSVSGGQAPYNWSSESLPPGFSIDPSGHSASTQLSGVPTQAGDFKAVIVSATSGSGSSPQARLSISIHVESAAPPPPPPPPAQTNNAQFVSQNPQLPSSMAPGQKETVSIIMKNTGTTTWTKAAGYKLDSQNPRDNLTWGVARSELGSSDSIAPNQTKTFVLSVTAPTAPGSYNFKWQMLKEGMEWFGDASQNISISIATTPLPCEYPSPPAGYHYEGGQPYPVCGAHLVQDSSASLSIGNSPSAPIKVGDTWQFSASYDSDGSGPQSAQTVQAQWNSSDQNVATIDQSGLAKGVYAGTATISATYQNLTASANLSVATVPAKPQHPNSFQVLVDVNQINPDEAAQASRFAADGVSAITTNSPSSIDWEKTLQTLNAGTWVISEDNPGNTSQVDFVSKNIHRMVDGAMFYNEDGLGTPLTDAQIATYAAHVVPGFGPVGARIIVHTRSYGDGDPRQAQFNHALANANVSGGMFEFNPDSFNSTLKFDAGCKYVLSLHKKCYLLMPPNGNTRDYVGDIQRATNYFAQFNLLNNPDLYFVPATYVRPAAVHYLSTSASDRDSIEAVVKWLNDYRNNPPPPFINRAPIGFLEGVDSKGNVLGWSVDQDTPSQRIGIDFFVDGPAGVGTLAGTALTDQMRDDVNSTQNAIGTHGFTFSVPNQYRDGKPHKLYAYGMDSSAFDYNAPLSTLDNRGYLDFNLSSLAPPPPPPNVYGPTGYLEGLNASGNASGWSFDPDTPSQSININFYVDGPVGIGTLAGTAPANLLRADVNAAYNATGNHGFSWNIPNQYRDGKPHKLYAYGMDSGGLDIKNAQLATLDNFMYLAFNLGGTPPPSTSYQQLGKQISLPAVPQDASQYSPWVMHEPGWASYLMYYCKNTPINGVYRDRIWRTESWTDGKTNFINDQVVIEGQLHKEDDLSCAPGVVMLGNKWHMYYVGADRDTPSVLYLEHAVADAPGLVWQKKGRVLGTPQPFQGWLDTPSPIIQNGQIVLYFVGGSDQRLYKITSTDGDTFSAPVAVPSPQSSNGRVTYSNGTYYFVYSKDPSSP